MSKTIVAATGVGRRDSAAKTDLAQFEDRLEATCARLEAKIDEMVNRVVLNQMVVHGLLFVGLKFC